jgi:hypothetical protein
MIAPGKAAGKGAVSGSQRKEFKPAGVLPADCPETGGVIVWAERHASNTMFVVLHEPFEKMEWRLGEFRRIQQTEDAVAVAIRGREGSPVNDRFMVRMGDRAEDAVTLTDGQESFTFRNFAVVRLRGDGIDVSGDLQAMRIKANGAGVALRINGEERKTEVREGWLTFGVPAASALK